MGQNYWLIILFVAVLVCNNGYCRPRELDLSNIHPVYRSVKQVDHEALNSFHESGAQRSETNSHDVSQEGKFNIESIATVARASNDGPSAPSSAVIGQFVDAVSQMVESDIRTPPKLKEFLKEKNNDRRDVPVERFRPMPVTFVYDDDDGKPEKVLQNDASEGKASSAKVVLNEGVKGVAIPVVMDDSDDPMEPINKLEKVEVTKPVKDERKKNGVTRNQVTTTPSSGLSTWILLSDNRDVATPPSKKNNKKDESSDDKKKMTTVAMTRKIVKVQSTTAKSTAPVKKVTPKPGNPETKKPETETTATSALEAMVKTQKKGLTTTTTTTPRPKTTEVKPSGQRKQASDSKKKVSEKLDVAETKNKVEGTVQNTKTVYTLPPHFVIATEDPTAVNATEQNGSSSVTENTVEGTTKKKKTSAKKKKKNNKKKKKTETGVEPKIPGQQVGSQIYDFLSREIVPTVGLGLIGVALTAGLASFLGYNPFASSTVPLRRTYETNHGYSPSNYYSYNTDYSDGGQSEEVLLREVLSGMPEESRYGLTHGDATYSDSYNRNDQSYDRMKTPVYSSKTGTMYNPEKEPINYETTYSQEYSTGDNYEVQDKKFTPDYNEKYPVYTRETGTSFVYPETPAMTEVKSTRQGSDSPAQNTKNEKYSKMTADTIERQPEALYRVAAEGDVKYRNGESSGQGISSQSHWHRMGTPVDSAKDYSRVEPGPRSLDFTKESGKTGDKKSRNKRAVGDNIQRIARKRTNKENDAENEIDFDDPTSDRLKNSEPNFVEFSTTKADAVTGMTKDEETTDSTRKAAEKMESSTTDGTKENSSEDDKDSNEDKKEEEEEETTTASYPIDDPENDSVANTSFLDILKRLAQFKLKVGLNFLRSTTDMFSRYLDVIQRKVDESFTNTTTVQYNRRKNPWSRIFYGGKSENLVRRKRSALEENPFLTSLLTEEGKISERFSKSTKKELKTSGKMFYSKKSSPKKYEPKTRH